MLIFTIRRLIGSVLVLLASSFIVFMFCARVNTTRCKPYRARNPLPPPAFFAAEATPVPPRQEHLVCGTGTG